MSNNQYVCPYDLHAGQRPPVVGSPGSFAENSTIPPVIQGWNKFCFTGGILEVRAKLPGEAYIGGLWPAIWMLGNMARATYVGSANWIWPWSMEKCNRNLQKSQLISGCNADSHYGMAHYHGRGAPEIDMLEAMPGKAKLPPSPVGRPYFSTSLQVAPGLPSRPNGGQPPGPGQW